MTYLGISWGQVSTEEFTITEDYKKAQQIVEEFCQAWINKDYITMYQYLSEAAKERQSEQEFIKKYQIYEFMAGQLIQRPLFPPAMVKVGRMLIRVEVKTEETSDEITTVKSVELGLVMDKEKNWKIERIHIPIPRLTQPTLQ